MPDYTSSEHADQLVNHWYWRPGFRPGRAFYTWHLTFEGQDDLHRLVADYQQALSDVPGLDLVPLPWLHITMQGIGFLDEVPEHETNAIADAVRDRLAEVPPPSLTFHRPTIRPQAITLYPAPGEAVSSIRNAIRTGIADILGQDRVPERDASYEPHLSIAYANTARSALQAREAFNVVNPTSTTTVVHRASLIALKRDGHLYYWEQMQSVPLGKN